MRSWLPLALLCWTVSATPLRAVDGDTITIVADVWPSLIRGAPVMVPERVRVLGVDTPERGKPGYREATAYTAAWIHGATLRLIVCSEERDSFGRLLATVMRKSDGANLTTDLLRDGHAVPYKR